MEKGTNTKAEILALLEGRSEEDLAKIHQFIHDLDELEHIEFLYPSDPDFAEELTERDAEARAMLENLRDMEATLRDLDQGKIRIQ
jgi:hypothetical protein